MQADFPDEAPQEIIYWVARFKELLSNAAQGDDIFLNRLIRSGILDVDVHPPLDLPTDVPAQGMYHHIDIDNIVVTLCPESTEHAHNSDSQCHNFTE